MDGVVKQPSTVSQEWEPPAACITRIVKAALPQQVQVTKEAKSAFSKSAGIFILYLTTCANDHCREKKRQTVSATDVLQAITDLEMEEFKLPLQTFLSGYRANEGAKRKSRQAPSAAKSSFKAKQESTESNFALPMDVDDEIVDEIVDGDDDDKPEEEGEDEDEVDEDDDDDV